MEKLKASLKIFLVVVVAPAFLVVSIAFAVNFYKHQNIYIKSHDGSVSASKVDGIFSYTEFYRSKNGQVEVRNYTYFGLKRIYVDFNGNGEVSSLELDNSDKLYGGGLMKLSRDVDFQKYSKEFLDADRDLQRQMKRFKEFFD